MRTTTRYYLCLAFVWMYIGVIPKAHSQGLSPVEWTGYLRNYTGVLLQNTSDLSIVQNTLNLNLDHRSSKGGIHVNPTLYQSFDRELEWNLREAYVDVFLPNLDVRLGKQQIIWGKAEGVFITDVVSPKDLREFLLPDFSEIRTGITALRLNWYKGAHQLEWVWSPIFTPTRMPESSSIWAPDTPLPAQVTWDYSAATHTASIENSELFLRYSLMQNTFDLELTGGYFFYDDPALNVQLLPGGTIVRPEYHRVSMGGGSVSMPWKSFVLRGEGAFYSGRHFQTSNPAVEGFHLEKNNLHYMLGVDYAWNGLRLSTQFIQETILEHETGMLQEAHENTLTVMANKTFLREKLGVELFSYIGLNRGDALVRPTLSYALDDGMEGILGANLFLGASGRFGQYNENDMLYAKLIYHF